MLNRLAGLFKKKPALPAVGEAFAAAVAVSRPAAGAPADTVALVFSPSPEVRDDPVYLSRVQWRLQALLYHESEPEYAGEAATRDGVRPIADSSDLPRTYHLSDEFTPPAPVYVAEFALPAGEGAPFDFDDHNSLPRLRYDLSGPAPRAELVPQRPDPTAVARRRLEAMLERGAQFAWAELAQANYQLYEPGEVSAPCMVMFSFDYTVSAEEMRAWCERLHPLKFTNPDDPVLRDAVWPLEADDQAWYYHRRFTLPPAFTGGREVFLADLWAHRPFIDGRFRHRHETARRPRRVPCLAEKKDWGWAGIELIPFNEADEYQRRASRERT